MNDSCFDKMDLSTGINSKEQNAAVFMQERKPQMTQMPVHSAPKGLTGKAEVFRRHLQELDEDITSFSSKFSSPSKVQPESAKAEALKLKNCLCNLDIHKWVELVIENPTFLKSNYSEIL